MWLLISFLDDLKIAADVENGKVTASKKESQKW